MSNKKKNVENKISLRMFAEGVGGLQRNGFDLVCPYQAGIPMKQVIKGVSGQQQEQISIQKTTCNTSCPLAKVNDDDTIDVCCGATPIKYTIEKVIEVPNDNNSGSGIGNPPFMGVVGKA